MSVSNLARSLATDGRFSTFDAQRVLRQTAQQPGAAEEVKKLLADPGFSALVTPGARKQLSDFISAQAPQGGSLESFPDGTQVFLKQGVFVATPDAPLPTTPADYGQTLRRGALLFAEPGKNVAQKLSSGDKQAVVDRILLGLKQCAADGPRAGYSGPTQAAQQRSSSATVLREIMGSLKGADPAGRLLQDKCLKALVDLVQKETNPGLRDHMAFHLGALKGTLATPEQQALAQSAAEKFSPVKPPYETWFANGNTTLNVVCHTGSEFYESEVRSWEADGFRKVEEGGWNKPTILEKQMAGPNGQATTVRLRMYNGDSGMFDDMNKPDTHVVAYSGHSGWGKNVPRALKGSPEAVGQKVLLLHKCCGQGVINKLRDKYPDQQVVTTRYSSYEHEDHFAFKTFLNGVAGRKSWEDIHGAIANGGSSNRRNNYITPADELTRMKTYDADGDGRADLLDKVYDFDAFDVPGDTATAFVPKEPSARDAVLAGSRIHNTSQIVNTTLGFSDFLDHLEKENPFTSGGYFTATAGSPEENRLVRIVEKKVDLASMDLSARLGNQKSSTPTVYQMQLNRRFAHASEEVVKAAGFLETALKYGDGATRADKVLQGLTLVAHSLDVDVEFGREREIFDNLVKSYGLPATLTYDAAKSSLKADSHTYAGSDKGLDGWKRTLGAAELAKLNAMDSLVR